MSYLCDMEVRAKKALGQHFLTDQSIAMRIVDALQGSDALEVGPGMGVLTQYLLKQNCVSASTHLHPQGGLRGVPLRLPESLGTEGTIYGEDQAHEPVRFSLTSILPDSETRVLTSVTFPLSTSLGSSSSP